MYYKYIIFSIGGNQNVAFTFAQVCPGNGLFAISSTSSFGSGTCEFCELKIIEARSNDGNATASDFTGVENFFSQMGKMNGQNCIVSWAGNEQETISQSAENFNRLSNSDINVFVVEETNWVRFLPKP